MLSERTPSEPSDGWLPQFISVLCAGILMSGLIVGVVAGVDDLAPTESALYGTRESVQICDRSARPLINVYNDEIKDVPKLITIAVRGREIHGVVHNEGGGDYTFVTGPDGTIQSHAAGTPPSPSLRVITNCDTFVAITSAEDPVSVFWSAYRDGRIKIVGVGFANWLVIEVLKNLPGLKNTLWNLLWIILFILIGIVGYVTYRRYAIYARRRADEATESGLKRK